MSVGYISYCYGKLLYSANFKFVFCFSTCRYFIVQNREADGYFTIDEMEGTIATNTVLDRESTAQYNFSIMASKVSKYGSIRIAD